MMSRRTQTLRNNYVNGCYGDMANNVTVKDLRKANNGDFMYANK